MKDTYVSAALTAGVNTAWLEVETGVRYETLRRHYGQYVRTEGTDQLAKLARLAPTLAPMSVDELEDLDLPGAAECERGDLNPGGRGGNAREFERLTVRNRHRPPRSVSGGHTTGGRWGSILAGITLRCSEATGEDCFNRTYREEVLDAYVVDAVSEVQALTDDWLPTYNDDRPHEALGRIPPTRFLPRPSTRRQAPPESRNAWCP